MLASIQRRALLAATRRPMATKTAGRFAASPRCFSDDGKHIHESGCNHAVRIKLVIFLPGGKPDAFHGLIPTAPWLTHLIPCAPDRAIPQHMPDDKQLRKIFEQNEVWRVEQTNADPDFFTKLGQGHNPRYVCWTRHLSQRNEHLPAAYDQ